MTVENERLKRWTLVGDAMDAGEFDQAIYRLDLLAANFQNVPDAFRLYEKFKNKVNDAYEKGIIKIDRECEKMDTDPLTKNREKIVRFGEMKRWQAEELYKFVAKLANDYKLFPAAVEERK